MADRAGQLDVPHPLAADLRARDLDAALVAADALVARAVLLSPVALPVLGGTEESPGEKARLPRPERAVGDRPRLPYPPLRPPPEPGRACEREADGREIIGLEHDSPPRRRL